MNGDLDMTPIENIPELTNRTKRILIQGEIKHLEELTDYTDSDLLRYPGIGRGVLQNVERVLEQHNLALLGARSRLRKRKPVRCLNIRSHKDMLNVLKWYVNHVGEQEGTYFLGRCVSEEDRPKADFIEKLMSQNG